MGQMKKTEYIRMVTTGCYQLVVNGCVVAHGNTRFRVRREARILGLEIQ